MKKRFYSFLDAVNRSAELTNGELLEDGTFCKFSPDALIRNWGWKSYTEGGNAYWCVDFDGSIGYTKNNGRSVVWLYQPVYIAENRFYVLFDAVKRSARITNSALLEDNAGTRWVPENLMRYENWDYREKGGGAYWCVGFDGSISYTENNGHSVIRWYRPVWGE